MLNSNNLKSQSVFSPMFYFNEKGIRYHGLSVDKPVINIPFDKMREYQLIEGKAQSLMVGQLAYQSLDCPSRVYHLAGYINHHFPEIEWDWETQLMDFEVAVREHKYGDGYFKKTGHNCQTFFDTDWDYVDWLIGLNSHLKSCESDEQLEVRCKERMKKWFKGAY
jgi:hypothetical protein